MKTSFAPASHAVGRVTPLGPVGPAVPPSTGIERSNAAAARRAIVIGSGFGGLAAAVRLSCKGYRVTVLEKLGQPGGRAGVWQQDGFTFDAGPTIVTAPFMLEELWSLCGRRFADDVTLVPVSPFYRIRYDDGTHFDYGNDAAANREQIRRISPADLPGYERFVAEAEKCYQLGFEKLGAIAYDKFGDLVKASPNLVRMRGWRSLYGMVASHMKHPKLRVAFSLQSLLIGGNPFNVTSIYSLINALERRFGVHWAMGGTGALVRGLVGLLEARGVPVRCNAEVKRIHVEHGRATGVELAGGERLAADIVVSNADTAWTYRHLVAPEHRPHWTDKRIEGKKYSMSLFVWYFGTNKQYEEVPHHTMVLGPRYEGLLKDIFERHHVPDDFSLYLHRPTATDPGMAPDGHDGFYALSPVPHLDSGTDWAATAESYRQRIEQRLATTVLPGLGAHIVSSRVTTPQDFHDRLLSYKGAAFGMEPLLTQSAYFRPHNRSEDVAGLYMVGAGTHPGAGVPGVLMSAKALETVVPDVKTRA
ncbi:MAG: phytoene desaturase [Betaproteobacteria bacterium]|nr:phytoene desaturase [Betaproteobacteria bacterium]